MIVSENAVKSALSIKWDANISLWKTAVVVPILVVAVMIFGVFAILITYLAIGLTLGLMISSDKILKSIIRDWEKEKNKKHTWEMLIATAIFEWGLFLVWKNEDKQALASP